MPAELSNLTRDHARLTHTFEDGTSVTIDYRPGHITPRQLHRTQALSARPIDELTSEERTELMDDTMQFLSECLIDWDLEHQGVPIPPTLEGLEDVHYDAQAVILRWIVEDQQMGKANGTGPLEASSMPISASQAPAPTILSSRRRRNGTTTARRLNGSA
jgi:hypothetical protein